MGALCYGTAKLGPTAFPDCLIFVLDALDRCFLVRLGKGRGLTGAGILVVFEVIHVNNSNGRLARTRHQPGCYAGLDVDLAFVLPVTDPFLRHRVDEYVVPNQFAHDPGARVFDQKLADVTAPGHYFAVQRPYFDVSY